MIGDRTISILNVSALIVACVVAAENIYLERSLFGSVGRNEVLIFIIPALVMFVIRNRKFSSLFLFFYVLISIKKGSDVRDVYLSDFGTFKHVNIKGFTGFEDIFFVVAIACLAIYLGFNTVRFVVSGVQKLMGKNRNTTISGG